MSIFASTARLHPMRLSTLSASSFPRISLAGRRAFMSSTSLSRQPSVSAILPAASMRPRALITTSKHVSRPFSTSRLLALRESYFQRPVSKTRSGFSRGGGGNGGSWWRNFRRRLDSLPPMYVVYGLIGINVGIYSLWQYAHTSWTRFRDPSLYYWMTKNFIVSEANFAAGRL